MDIKIEKNHDENDSFQFDDLPKEKIATITDDESSRISTDNCTVAIANEESNEISTDNCTVAIADEELKENSTDNCTSKLESHENCTTTNKENQEEYINLSSTKSELESEATNLSSTLDSRDEEINEYEKECDSSLDLSYKNKSLPNSVESSLDNSESVVELEKPILNLESDLSNSEKTSIEDEKILFIPKINGSNSSNIEEHNESEVKIENFNSIENNNGNNNNEHNFTLSENSCSSSSSSGLVIDQQLELNTNTNVTQSIERDKSEDTKERVYIEEASQNTLDENSKVETNSNLNNKGLEIFKSDQIDTNKGTDTDLSVNLLISENSNQENIENQDQENIENPDQESVTKQNNLKRKRSISNDFDNFHDSVDEIDKVRSPEHKILHLDKSYLNDAPVNLEKNLNTSTKILESELINNANQNLKETQLNDKECSNKIVDRTVDVSSPILRNQLVLKNPDNDPGGVVHIPNSILNRVTDKIQIDTPSSTTSEENLQNDSRNSRFDVQLSNYGNNYLYEKSDNLIALNSSEISCKINQDNLETSNEDIKSNESTKNSNEIKDFSVKPNKSDFANNLNSNKVDLSTQKNTVTSEIRNTNALEMSSNNKKSPTSKDTLIDLTDDNLEALPSTNSKNLQCQTPPITQKEKILQDWNKMKSLPSTNQSQIYQDLNKELQQSFDMKRHESTPFNNQSEQSSILNKLDTNYPNNSKLYNSSWKYSVKYGKKNQSAEVTTNKSLKRSSKNLYQNNKSSRQNNLSKKFKDYSLNTSSTNYSSSSIINSPQFNLSNKLNQPIIPPVYELSHSLNRHAEYKCSKCYNSNFKSIRELENHQKFCLFPHNPSESIFLNAQQHHQQQQQHHHQQQQQQLQQLGLSSINNNNNSRISQFSTGLNSLIPNVDDVMLNIPKEPTLSNFRNILSKQQPSLYNINDKPIEITPNLNHYLTQVEQKHKNLLQQHQHHINPNQNLFSHSLDETLKRSFLQNDIRQQNIMSACEQKLNSDNHSNRYGSLLNSSFHSKKKLHNLQQHQLPASFLDNENILDYPIIQDSSSIFDIKDSPLNFNASGLQKSGNVGIIKDLRRLSNSNSRYGSNIDLSSNPLSVLSKQPLDNTIFSSTLQQKADSLEPIMLKVKQNQFSPVLPPEQLLNKLITPTSISTPLSSASSTSSFQESTNLNNNLNLPVILDNHPTMDSVVKKSAVSEIQNNNLIQVSTKNFERESKNKAVTHNTTNMFEKSHQNIFQVNNENRKTKCDLIGTNNVDKKTKKLFLCSSCGSYHENWNLFLHMREMHKRHICLVCLRMFPTAEQLTVHLEMKHDIEQNHFESQEKLIRSSRDSCYLMCCTCEHIFTEHDDFYQHACANYLKPCTLCGLLGKHAQTCKYSTNEHKKNKRNKKIMSSKLPVHQHKTFDKTVSKTLNNDPLHLDLSSSQVILGVDVQQGNSNENLKTFTNEQQPTEYNDCDIISSNQNNNYFKDNQNNKYAADNSKSVVSNDERNSDSNNESDSDSNNKVNGYLEHFNYNDNDLINLYRSNRLANLAKQKEKEEAEAEAQVKPVSNDECEPTENLTQNIESELHKNTEEDFNSENSENIFMPKLTLKISKKLLSQATNLVDDDSEEQSSTESTDDEDNYDNENEIKSDTEENDTTIETEENQQNTSSTLEKESEVITAPLEVITAPNQFENTENQENIEKPSTINIKLETFDNDDAQTIKEHDKQNDENKFKKGEVLDDNKSDSDMDIDVTCNQGGDVAPISNLVLQQEPAYFSNSVPAKELDATDGIELDKICSQPSLENITENNETTNESQKLLLTNNSSGETEELKPVNSTEMSIDEETDKNEHSSAPDLENSIVAIKKIPTDGIELADEDVQILDLNLDAPLDKITMITLLRIMLKKTFPICLYCNHARRIAVNGNSLALHMLSSHRFSATVDSITAEELLPGTIISKLKSYVVELDGYYFNMETYCNIDRDLHTVSPTIDEKIFECFSCRFSTKIHKELYLHNRKMHLRTAILCFMCRSNFYSYSEILCHICPGAQHKVVLFDIKFRCCICELDQIPSAFRLMVHFRKAHFACDVCLENCHDQSRLSSHVWKHKLHHLCYRCGIAYRNKPDITKHLFWKHGTESILCKRCLQKRWPHVYHFCVPPSNFVCDICNLTFTRAVFLKVHKRLHSGDAPYPCTEDNCEKKFISRKLLLKHVEEHEKIQNEEKSAIANESNKTVKEETDSNTNKQEESGLKDENASSEGKNEIKALVEKTEAKESKKKKKKTKRSSETKESLDDLNLQAPNLSESGSSDDSDLEQPVKPNSLVPDVVLSPPSEQDDEDDIKPNINSEKITDIWNNFKTFQATQSKVEDSGIEDSNLDPPTPILHVAQSDHDYCKMYKITTEKPETLETGSDNKDKKDETNKLSVTKNSDANNRSLLLPISPSKKKQKSAKKSSHTKSGSESSSSDGSSSSSDSSCTCGSNCSCSSSSGSSSDSSSSSDTDSSSSEGKKRIAAKRAAKEEKRRNRLQSENSSKANNSDVVDVVTTDTKPEVKPNEPVIYEDDLETDESDTDEDFYDEHPQKLASEILAEKRRQLMKQTSLSPSHNFDIVENSRPSTPSLPEDVYGAINNREKKVKVKKKKHDRKASNKNLIPPFKLNITKTNTDGEIIESSFVPCITPILSSVSGPIIMASGNQNDSFISPGDIDVLSTINSITQSRTENQTPEISSVYQQSSTTTTLVPMNYHNVMNSNVIPAGFSLTTTQPLESTSQNLHPITTQCAMLNPAMARLPSHSGSVVSPITPAPIDPNLIRHSTESSSDASANLFSNAGNALKRSKRARRPNRFYGYSSDDESVQGGSIIGVSGVFKPIPPPNLTWRKEDLPAPPRNHSGKSLKPPGFKTSLLSANKKMKLFSKKKDNANKKERPFGSKLLQLGNSTDAIKPRIPPLKIKPLDILSQIPPSILDHQPMETSIYQIPQPPPPVVEPINTVPPVPVHHIDAPQFYPSSKESIDSDSESDEDKLTIPLQMFNTENKLTAQSKTSKKSSTPKTSKSNQGKNKNKIKNSNSVARTSYNTKPQQQINNVTPLQTIAMEVRDPTPPPKEKKIPPALLPNPDLTTLQYFKRNNIRFPIRPPAGARPPREGESVYCYCRCPYDEVSEMIACDGDECMIEWFHFECVGILVAPQGKWFCAECKPNQQIYSSPLNTTLQLQHQQIADGFSSNGKSSIGISEVNGPSSNNGTIGSIGY